MTSNNNLIKLKKVGLIVAGLIMDRKMLFNSGRRSKKHLNEVHQRNIEKWSNAFEDQNHHQTSQQQQQQVVFDKRANNGIMDVVGMGLMTQNELDQIVAQQLHHQSRNNASTTITSKTTTSRKYIGVVKTPKAVSTTKQNQQLLQKQVVNQLLPMMPSQGRLGDNSQTRSAEKTNNYLTGVKQG